MEQLTNIFQKAQNENIYKIIISNPLGQYKKIVGERLKDDIYQFAQYTETQVFHQNIKIGEIQSYLKEQMSFFKQIEIWSLDRYYLIKISKKQKVFITEKEIEKPQVKLENNRKKKYILAEGTKILPLVDLGIFTNDYKVIKSMYDKYKQINRFIEMIDDSLNKLEVKQLNILDFGCGKSYLTFIVYYYLTFIKKIDVNIIGLDLKKDVIIKCNEIAKKYKYDKLHFELGDINGYVPNQKIDMVISLHACDIATDYALYNAIKWDVKMIFSVPCCQHELNNQINTNKFKTLTKYGIIKERFCALATDAIRGGILEAFGYNTQLLEFIDISHSPKNILIRAIKTNIGQEKRKTAQKDVEKLIEEFDFKPTLYELLKQELK